MARMVFSSTPYEIRTSIQLTHKRMHRYHGVTYTYMYTGRLLSTERIRKVIRTLRSDHAGDMHAVNANDTAKGKGTQSCITVSSTPSIVPDDDGSPLITQRDLSHRFSPTLRGHTARAPRRAHLTDARVITFGQVSRL